MFIYTIDDHTIHYAPAAKGEFIKKGVKPYVITNICLSGTTPYSNNIHALDRHNGPIPPNLYHIGPVFDHVKCGRQTMYLTPIGSKFMYNKQDVYLYDIEELDMYSDAPFGIRVGDDEALEKINASSDRYLLVVRTMSEAFGQ